MKNTDDVYIQLQKHLDKQAVGFPATQSGVEIRILKELFTPEQAGLALYLSYQPKSAHDILNQAKDTGISLKKVESLLEGMERNGAICSTLKNDIEHYYTMPLLVGVVELHGNKATRQFWADFSQYTSGEYGKAYTNTKVSQLRTVPLEKSIPVEQHVATYDQIREIIKTTDGPIVISKCMCREGAKQMGHPCHVTSREETCMCFGDWARHFIKLGLAKEVTREQALEVTRKNEEDGLVLQPTNYQRIDFVCACCRCCCGVLTRLKMLPDPAVNWAHNFYAVVDTEKCTACGTCVEKCQMIAAKVDEQNGYSVINLDRCIGCGNCVASCPSEALKLVKKEKEIAPPQDSTGLYKILAERKS